MQHALEPEKSTGVFLCATHCPYCALQCGMNLKSTAEHSWSVVARVFPTNRGGLCQKGWTAAGLLEDPGRLRTPLVRDHRSEPLRAATWEDALERIRCAIERTQVAYGRNTVGVFGGGSLTNEKAYLLGKFARVALKTSQIDYNGRFCMSSAAAASINAFGLDRGLPFPIADIAGAETILLVGSNLAETMPPVMQYFEEQKRRGGSLIVVDPRGTLTAASSKLHLQITPGTDAALANGLLHIAVKEGYIDEDFIAARTHGFDLVRRAVSSYWPARVERITGIPEQQLQRAARLLGQARTAIILTARGPEQQSHGVNNALAFINLALALGKAGKPYCGYGCLTGQGNGQGGREHGQKADQLPGYRRLDNPEHRAHIARIWGVSEPDLPAPGLSAYEMLDAIGSETGVRALLVFGSNLVISAPNASHIEQRLANLDFLMVSDFFLSETAERADVVLPAAQWAEEEGTMTNLEGRVILRRRAACPPQDVRTDLEILAVLAGRLGCGQLFPSRPADHSGRWRFLALSGRRSSGHPAPVCGPLPHQRRARPIPCRGISLCRGGTGFRIPPLPDYRPHHFAISIGNPDPPGTGPDPGIARAVRRDPSFDGADVWNSGGRPGASDHPARDRFVGGAPYSADSHGHAIRPISFQRIGTRQPAHQRGIGPRFAYA